MKKIDEIFNMRTMVNIDSYFSEILKRFINKFNIEIINSINREIYTGLD
jgi:hypothetical protein